MKRSLVRIAVLVGGVALVASCDTRMPTATTIPVAGGTGGTGGTGGSSSQSGRRGPTVVVDSPLAGALINVGDSVLVTVRLSAPGGALKSATMKGVTEKGSVDLGTYTQTDRYKAVSIPASGFFRPGLRDTVIRRYLQPIAPSDTSLDSLRIIVVGTDSAGVADTTTRVI